MREWRIVSEDRVEWLGRNFGNQSGKSDKFYEIIVTESSCGGHVVETRRWGRYGSKGQTKVIDHYSVSHALCSARDQIEKKMDKGYTRPVDALTRLATAMED